MQLIRKKDKTIGKVLSVEIDQIQTNPAQPRTEFEQKQLQLLANSILENGLLQPITLRKNNTDDYELISGERRLRACKMIGFSTIPCIIVEKTEQESAVLSMIENLHRQDLNMFEQARALKNLIMEWGMTQEQAAIKIGMAQSTLANKIRLLRLSNLEQTKILSLQLTERHARVLLKLPTEQQRKQALHEIEIKKYNVYQAEKLIETILQPKQKRNYIPIIKDIRVFINTINKAIDVMKLAGIATETKKNDQQDYIEYVIKISKTKTN